METRKILGINPGYILLLVSVAIYIFLLAGRNLNSSNINTAIAWGNQAVSYPAWAALTPTEDRSKVSAVDLITGKLETLEEPGIRFNGIHGISDSGGDFVITSWDGRSSTIFTYNFASKQRNTMFEVTKELRAPFILSGRFCALHPQSKTNKQSYNYEVLCKDTDGSDRILIRNYDSYAFSEDIAVFIDKHPSEPYVYIIQNGINGLEMRTVQPEHGGFLNLLGFHDGVLYFYNIMSRGRITVYRWINDRLVEDDGEIARRVIALRGKLSQKFFLADSGCIVAVNKNADDNGLESLLWNGKDKAFEAFINTQ